MTGSITRSVGSVLLGFLAAMVLIVAIEGVSAILHPFPPGVDTSDPEVVKAHVARYPGWILGLVVVAWGFTMFVSVWLATRLGAGRHAAHGIVVGLILLFAAVANMLMLPYAVWFEIITLMIFAIGIYLGVKLGRGGKKT